MQQVLEKQRKKATAIVTKEQYEQAWKNFWLMGEKLAKHWKTKKSWLEVLREERGK